MSLALISVIANALLGALLPVIGKKLANRNKEVQKVTSIVNDLAVGFKVVENAISDAKVNSTAGKAVTGKIKRYGPIAIAAVDTARSLASQIATVVEAEAPKK